MAVAPVGCMRILLFTLVLAFLPNLALARPTHVLRIHKSERKMELEVGGEVVRTFVVALGGAPKGDKEVQGDLRTPEGEFYVAWKNPRSSFHRFLGLSYPMSRHADAALKNGTIDAATRDEIAEKIEAKQKPPQLTALGGLVGIHGGGSGADWTLGCIAVSDEEIEWIYSKIREGDIIVVHP